MAIDIKGLVLALVVYDKRKKAKDESLKHEELLKNIRSRTEFIATSRPTAHTSESATELANVVIENQLTDNRNLGIELHCSEEVSVEQQIRSPGAIFKPVQN